MGNGVSFFTPNKEMAGRASMAMMQGGRQVYSMPGAFYGKGFDSAVASGMAYITGELEKMDPKVREPLTSVTWQRDMVAKTGGGWVEYTSTYNVDYGTTGPNDLSIVGTASNTIPVMQVSTEKNLYKVFTWMHMMRINFVDMAKAKQKFLQSSQRTSIRIMACL